MVQITLIGTKYEVVKEVGKRLPKWQISVNPKVEWDVAWMDTGSELTKLGKLKPFQRVNCFPGINCMTRKDGLSKNLMELRKSFPKHYDFFPETFILPEDHAQFKAQFAHYKDSKTFIIKPQASSQGKGIFLTKTWANIPYAGNYIAQRYISRPYLLEGLKFDLRIYVLLQSCDPLKIYIFDDGLARFATKPYEEPNANNIDDMFVHLTNYAINKNNPGFVFNSSAADDSTGHKRSLKALFKV